MASIPTATIPILWDRLPFIPTFARYWKIFRQYSSGSKMITLVILTVLNSFFESLGILMLLPLLAMGEAKSENTQTLKYQITHGFFEFIGLKQTTGSILGLLVFFFVLKGIFNYFSELHRANVVKKITQRLIRDLLRGYSRVDYLFYTNLDTGTITSTIATHAFRMGGSFASYVTTISFLLSTCIYLYFSFVISRSFTMYALVAGMVVLFLTRTISKKTKAASLKYSESYSALYKLLIQTIQNFKYLASTSRLPIMQNKVEAATADNFYLSLKMNELRALSAAILDPVVAVVLASVLYYQLVILGNPISGVAVAILLLQRTMKQVLSFQQIWQSFLSSSGSVDIVESDLKRFSENQGYDGQEPYTGFSKSIVLKDVSFAYKEKPVLDRVSITIPKNATVAFVGESGAGKSTLVDILTGMLKVQSGKLLIDGKELSQIRQSDFRKLLGYVTQESVVFDDNVANNVSLWNSNTGEPEAAAKLLRATRAAYCDTFINSMPLGVETVLGDRGIKLSGGQRQRLAIARELYKEPEILILDEATSALDSESEQYIQKSIDDLKGRMTVIIIAHRLSTIRNADIIYVLSEGKVLEAGNYQELLNRKESKFRDMCKLQSLV